VSTPPKTLVWVVRAVPVVPTELKFQNGSSESTLKLLSSTAVNDSALIVCFGAEEQGFVAWPTSHVVLLVSTRSATTLPGSTLSLRAT